MSVYIYSPQSVPRYSYQTPDKPVVTHKSYTRTPQPFFPRSGPVFRTLIPEYPGMPRRGMLIPYPATR